VISSFIYHQRNSKHHTHLRTMSDHEVETFESTDAGASKTVPMQAGSVRKGGYIVIKGKACKVIDVSTSKTGKHGHAKCHFVAEDIFTGKRCDELVPAGHNLEVPVVSKTEYTLLDIDDDDHMSLMDEKGDTREDLKLPDDRSGDSAFALAQEVQKKFDEGAEVVVTIMSAMGIDQLSGWKEAAN